MTLEYDVYVPILSSLGCRNHQVTSPWKVDTELASASVRPVSKYPKSRQMVVIEVQMHILQRFSFSSSLKDGPADSSHVAGRWNIDTLIG